MWALFRHLTASNHGMVKHWVHDIHAALYAVCGVNVRSMVAVAHCTFVLLENVIHDLTLPSLARR